MTKIFRALFRRLGYVHTSEIAQAINFATYPPRGQMPSIVRDRIEQNDWQFVEELAINAISLARRQIARKLGVEDISMPTPDYSATGLFMPPSPWALSPTEIFVNAAVDMSPHWRKSRS